MEDITFKTENLALASYIAALGFPLKTVELREGTKQYLFVFDNNTDIAVAASLFGNGQAIINPIPYYESIKRLKRVLYDEQRAND